MKKLAVVALVLSAFSAGTYAHDAGAGQCERNAAGVNRDPATTPLLGDVGSSAGTASRVEHEVAGGGCHQNAPLNQLVRGLNDIDLVATKLVLANSIAPDIVKWKCREIIEVANVAKITS